MYFRLPTLLPVAALVAVAAAAPSELEARIGTQCNTGSMECCAYTLPVRFQFPRYSRSRPFRYSRPTLQSTYTTLNDLSLVVGRTLPYVDGLIGLGCTPIWAVGTGTGATCTQQPVCCTYPDYVVS